MTTVLPDPRRPSPLTAAAGELTENIRDMNQHAAITSSICKDRKRIMSVVVVWDAALYGLPGRVCCFDLNENEDPPPFRLVLLLVVSPFSIPSLEDEAFRRCISTIFLALEAVINERSVDV